MRVPILSTLLILSTAVSFSQSTYFPFNVNDTWEYTYFQKDYGTAEIIQTYNGTLVRKVIDQTISNDSTYIYYTDSLNLDYMKTEGLRPETTESYNTITVESTSCIITDSFIIWNPDHSVGITKNNIPIGFSSMNCSSNLPATYEALDVKCYNSDFYSCQILNCFGLLQYYRSLLTIGLHIECYHLIYANVNDSSIILSPNTGFFDRYATDNHHHDLYSTTNSIITIDPSSNPSDVSLYTSDGHLLYSTLSHNRKTMIDISKYPTDIYILNIRSSRSNDFIKIVRTMY